MWLPVVRSLLRDRSFSIISVLSLTLALGAIGAVLNIIDAVLLRTLPVEGPEDLLAIENVDASGAPRMFSYQMFRGVAENTKVFSSLFGWSEPILRVGEGPEFERVAAILATGDFAKTLNLRAWRGRFFTEVDDRSGSPLVVVVSYRFARRHFPAGDAALGATLTIEGAPFTVIGVAPQDFSGLQVGFSTDLLIPVSAAPLTLRDDSLIHSPSLLWLKILGRRKPEVSVDQVKASLAVLWPSVLESIAPSGRSAAWRKRFLSQRVRTVSAARGFSPLREQYELWLWGILTLTGLLAILAFMGVASQNLARALSRMQEMSIRLSLGATPARLVAPYGVEMFVLIAIAVSLSILGGYWGSKYLAAQVSLGPLPIYLNLVPTFRVIALTFVGGSLFGLLFGLLPLLVVTHFDLATFLRISGDQDILGPGRWKRNRLLAAAQVTVLTPFLVTAFLLSSTLVALQRVDPGYRPGNVLLQRLEPRTEGYGQLNVATLLSRPS